MARAAWPLSLAVLVAVAACVHAPVVLYGHLSIPDNALIAGFALAALLAAGSELQAAVGEALQFMDQSLDSGFRPGMGHVQPDRLFWAHPEGDDEDDAKRPTPS